MFISNKISADSDVLAEQLRSARAKKKLKLTEAADKLNINFKYLEYLENGEFDRLPAGVYGKNFLREYALFLDIKADGLIKIFEQSRKKTGRKQKELFIKKISRIHNFLAIPKIIKNIIIIFIIAVCVIYLGYYTKNIIAPPRLLISNPPKDFTTREYFIDVQGVADEEAIVDINGEAVLTDLRGVFIKRINLNNGLNTIIVTASKKHSQEAKIIRKILVDR